MGRYELSGATVVVTGASSGIGRAIAGKLLREYDCRVIGVGRNEEKFRGFSGTLGKAAERFSWQLFDVGERAEWETFARTLSENQIVPDLVINCAGVLPAFSAYEKGGAENTVKTNFFSAVYALETLTPLLRQSGRPKMINIGSSSSLCPFAGVAAYCASKAALQRFSECVSMENGIPVSVFMPGFTDTDVFRSQTFDEGTKGFFRKFSMSADRMAEKIVKAIKKGSRRKIFGADAQLMDWGYRLFPRLTPRLITKILRRAKPEVFGGISR